MKRSRMKCNGCGGPIIYPNAGRGRGGHGGRCYDCFYAHLTITRAIGDRTKKVACNRCGFVFWPASHLLQGRVECGGCQYHHVDSSTLTITDRVVTPPAYRFY